MLGALSQGYLSASHDQGHVWLEEDVECNLRDSDALEGDTTVEECFSFTIRYR